MDTKNFSNFLLKTSGMIIFIFTVINIPTYVNYFISFADRSFSIFMVSVLFPNILPLLIGLFLFNAPQIVTNKIILDGNELIERKGDKLHILLEQIALSVLGFYLLFSSVSDISFHLANFIQGKAGFTQTFRGDISYTLFFKDPTTFSTIIEFFFSLWVIFKAKAISRYVIDAPNTGAGQGL